jgi:hypothetical protein
MRNIRISVKARRCSKDGLNMLNGLTVVCREIIKGSSIPVDWGRD